MEAPNENWTFCENETWAATGNHILLFERFIFMGVIGGAVSFLGVFGNIVLLALIKGKHASVFVQALACFDIGMCIAFQCVIMLTIVSEYTGDMNLVILTFRMMRPMYLFGTSMKTGQTYLIMCASLDRYMMVRFTYMQDLQDTAPETVRRFRLAAIYIVLIVSFFQRLPKFYEVRIAVNPECTGFGYIYAKANKDFIYNPIYMAFQRYFSHVVDVYIPFAVLLILNMLILQAMHKKRSGSILLLTRMFNMECYRNYQRHLHSKQRKFREATHTLIAITSGYLISNIVNLGVSIAEHTDPDWLESQYIAYSLASDVSSFLVIVTCSSRIIVYYFCNSHIRYYIRRWLCNERGGFAKHGGDISLMTVSTRRKSMWMSFRRRRKPTWIG